MMLVVDASVVLEVLLATPLGHVVRPRLLSREIGISAPHLLDVEVAQVLRRFAARGELSAKRGRQALDDLAAMPIARYPHDMLLPRLWELRENLTAYDAAYVVLAESLDATMLTCDARVAHAPGHVAGIELVRL